MIKGTLKTSTVKMDKGEIMMMKRDGRGRKNRGEENEEESEG